MKLGEMNFLSWNLYYLLRIYIDFNHIALIAMAGVVHRGPNLTANFRDRGPGLSTKKDLNWSQDRST